MTSRLLSVLCVLSCCLALAQTYRCDWSVVAIGGGDMDGSNYKCGSTVGQTAAGQITGANYWALIGFWQPEEQVGVREQAYSPPLGPLVTRLYTPQPNPARTHVAIRYSLCAEIRVRMTLHDLTGRVVRTLADGVMRPGRYSANWDGRDLRARSLANGVYFVRFAAGDCRATEKVVLQR
jgi:hypothetical protein